MVRLASGIVRGPKLDKGNKGRGLVFKASRRTPEVYEEPNRKVQARRVAYEKGVKEVMGRGW